MNARIISGRSAHDRSMHGRIRPFAGMARQRGQSLMEVAVLCAVLVPLFLLVPILGKYIHIRQTTHQAARAAAWQATVSPDYAIPNTAEMRNLTIDRHFATSDAPIRSRASTGNANQRLGNPLLNTFSNQPLMERGDIRVNAYKNDGVPGMLDNIAGLIGKIPGDFPPNEKGLVTSNLTVDIQDIRLANGSAAAFLEPFDTLGLRMQASNTLLADPWNASGAGEGNRPHRRTVLAQVRGLVPASNLSKAGGVLDGLDVIPMFGVLSKLDPGYIEPDVVPYDKLERYAPRR